MNSERTKAGNVFRCAKLCTLVAVFLFCASAVIAQQAENAADKERAPAVQKEQVEENVRTGIIAGSTRVRDSRAFNVETGAAAPGDETSVIYASVSYVGNDRCEAKVTNNSPENAYSVSFRVIGQDRRGSEALRKSYSASLKPKESVTRSLRCKKEYSMAVVLKSAKKRK
jgi:hypothetical protein